MYEIPEKLLVFRMIHIDGLEFVLQNGMWSMLSGVVDSQFVSIGNNDVISKRKYHQVRLDRPGGKLGEYVPFYFHGHSPMLYNIITGYSNVVQLPQDDIVFLVCDARQIMASDLEWCFTDGQALKSITNYFNRTEDLQRLDWGTIYATYWRNTEGDNDRQRKKMSEFLVKNHVPVDYIRSIVVHSSVVKQKVEQLMKVMGKEIPVYVDIRNDLYYKQND